MNISLFQTSKATRSNGKKNYPQRPLVLNDRAERHGLWSRFLLIHSPFLLHSFFRREEKREKNNQSRGQKSCLSARTSYFKQQYNIYCSRSLISFIISYVNVWWGHLHTLIKFNIISKDEKEWARDRNSFKCKIFWFMLKMRWIFSRQNF